MTTLFTTPTVPNFEPLKGGNGLQDFREYGLPIKRTALDKEDIFYYEKYDQQFLDEHPELKTRTGISSFYDRANSERFAGEVTYMILENANYEEPNFPQYMSGASNSSESYTIRVFYQLDEHRGAFRFRFKGRNYTAASKMASILDDMFGEELFGVTEGFTLEENGFAWNDKGTSISIYGQLPCGEIIDIEVEPRELLEHVTGFEVIQFEMHIDGEEE